MMHEICKTQKRFTKTEIFDKIPKNSLKIKPVRILEWWYCPICGEVTYSGLCGHDKKRQGFSGTMIRSMIRDKVKPTKLIMRPEVFDMVMENADKYGFGSPFCTEEYLNKRQSVFEIPISLCHSHESGNPGVKKIILIL